MDLREYLFRHDIKVAQFARKIGYNGTYINGVVNGLVEAGPRLAKTISDATSGIVPPDGICVKKRGRALMLAKKACQGEQMTFAEMENK